MKVALVHDYFREWGGAEEVVAVWHDMWPEAPLFTSYFLYKQFEFYLSKEPDSLRLRHSNGREKENKLRKVRLKTSWMQYIPEPLKNKLATPMLPYAFASFKFDEYDVVLSSSAAFAKTIDTKKSTIHISYCHTPPRFLYGLQRERKRSGIVDIVEKPIDMWLKAIDLAAAENVDYFIAPSNVVKERIRRIYKRDSQVIYPPVDIDKFVTGNNQPVTNDYFVIIGRLSPIKHFELAIEACSNLGVSLKVIGEGTDYQYLQSIAGETIEFLGRLSNENGAEVIAGCKAVINTVFDEDFGMVPLEVLGAGKPVIAYASEAAQETMIHGVTGQFFYEQSVESLLAVIETFDETKYNPYTLREHAKQFSKEQHTEKLKQFVEDVV